MNAGRAIRYSSRAGRQESFMTGAIVGDSPIGLRCGVDGNTRDGAAGKASRSFRRLNMRDIFATQNSLVMKKIQAGL
jgi:hypothetical protein